jgi:hypothetical protein
MPKEIKSREEFEKLLPSATEIRVVRGKVAGSDGKKSDDSKDDTTEGAEVVQTKIKIRTIDQLYTFKTTDDEVQSLVKGSKAEVIEY